MTRKAIVISAERRYRSGQHLMNTSLFTAILVVLSAAALSGCNKEHQAEPDGYRVVSYDAVTANWVIIRTGTFDGKHLKKQLTVVCDFYKWADHETVHGPHACDLHVGELMVIHHQPDAQGKFSDYSDLWEMSPDRLSVTHGVPPDNVDQQFIILKNELLPETW
jgi:hypothetical protein